MGGILGGSKTKGQTVANGLSLQSSMYGNPVPIVYGTVRIAPNLIWYGDFVATPVSSGKGGKGSVIGGGGKSGGGQYTYQTAVMMALCEGPITTVGFCYVDKALENIQNLNMGLWTGTYPQTPWSYLLGQQVEYSETHTIPATGPYTVTLDAGSDFYQDGGAYVAGIETYTSVQEITGPGQYTVEYNLEGGLIYLFYESDIGNSVVINYYAGEYPEEFLTSVQAIIPIQGAIGVSNGVSDAGVVAAATALTNVTGTPGPGEYSIAPGGIYTFNAAQAGQQVTINFYLFTGTEALGYNGIAYLASSAYQLGESAALPNNNFEVYGVFSNTTSQEINGEQDEISAVAYTNTYDLSLNPGEIAVEFYQQFIADKGVTDPEGNPYTFVPSSPGYYEYTLIAAGVYQFSSANYGATVNITYTASIGLDADPSLVVVDFMTNPHYGAAFPAAYLGDFTSYQAYCIANGLLISTAFTTQVQASQPLQDIATATNSAWVWSNGQLTLIPYGDEIVSDFGYTYTPPTTPVFNLTDDDFLKNTDPIGATSAVMNNDPVILTRKRPADQINSIKMTCLDRANSYNQAVIEVKDQTLIETFKLRQSNGPSTTLFCNLAAAQQSAQLQLQRQYIMNLYTFQLDQRYIVLDPMDIVTLTDANLGLNQQWVRITELQENDDGSISFTAEEYLQGTASAATYDYQLGLGYSNNYNITPGNVNQPVIFEPTDALAGELAVWMSVSGMNTAIWGGCTVWISTDGNSYTNVGTIKGASRQGFLSAPLAIYTTSSTGQTIDQTDTLSVNLSESNGQLVSGSQSDATNLNTLCYVDGEYIAYETAVLTAQNQYNLTFLVRGVYDTTIGAHATGAQFARLDSSIFEYPYAAPLIGSTVLIKFLSFNVWGGGAQQLSDVEPFTYNVQGTAYTSPLPDVTNFATAYTSYSGGTTQLIWEAISDFRSPIDYEVRQGTSWANGNVLYRTPLLQGPINGDGTYWIAAHFKVPNGGPDIYSETPTTIVISGSQITQNIIASYDQVATDWAGTFVNTAITDLGLQLVGAGNILTAPNILTISDVLLYGSVTSSGTYEIPADQVVNVGRVAPCQIIIAMGTEVGYSLNELNILTLGNILTATNITGIDLGNNTSATAQINISQDGSTWGGWQNWIPGTYSGKAFTAQVVLETDDPDVLAVLTDFVFTVDVPTIEQSFINQSVSSGGTSLTFPSEYNGGPGASDLPQLQVTILNAEAGDLAVISSLSLSGFTIQVLNGGSGVARSVNIFTEGY